ncbi:PREDICTED: uncharacterized protein LOC109471418 [Branchiostoma belcheri]|uniref:Uncharacterized protein LOC109471418 n=1 Tax=Branchiostoma belcheri TaxID=7741 RepID=A0A6P4Z5F4_BRABE|nr:PREDICTED: uncharacterized protein LOC109471418 [Branchiostoma belcheri]
MGIKQNILHVAILVLFLYGNRGSSVEVTLQLLPGSSTKETIDTQSDRLNATTPRVVIQEYLPKEKWSFEELLRKKSWDDGKTATPHSEDPNETKGRQETPHRRRHYWTRNRNHGNRHTQQPGGDGRRRQWTVPLSPQGGPLDENKMTVLEDRDIVYIKPDTMLVTEDEFTELKEKENGPTRLNLPLKNGSSQNQDYTAVPDDTSYKQALYSDRACPCRANVTKWWVEQYPHPQTDFKRCGRPGPSWLCDPNRILTKSEANDIENIVLNVSSIEATPCPPKDVKELEDDEDSNNTDNKSPQFHGYQIAVALVFDLEKEYMIRENMENSKVYTATGKAVRNKLTNKRVREVERASRDDLEKNRTAEALKKILLAYKEFLAGPNQLGIEIVYCSVTIVIFLGISSTCFVWWVYMGRVRHYTFLADRQPEPCYYRCCRRGRKSGCCEGVRCREAEGDGGQMEEVIPMEGVAAVRKTYVVHEAVSTV